MNARDIPLRVNRYERLTVKREVLLLKSILRKSRKPVGYYFLEKRFL